MWQNKRPLVLATIIGGIVLVIVLAWIFIHGTKAESTPPLTDATSFNHDTMTESTPPHDPMTESTSPLTDASSLNFEERFVYDENSEISVDNLHCQPLDRIWHLENINDDIRAEPANYSHCKLEMILKNIGDDSYFPDSCTSWSSSMSISLVGEKQVYDQADARLNCSDVIVPFPSGESNMDIVSFIVNADDEITEINIEGSEKTFRIRRK